MKHETALRVTVYAFLYAVTIGIILSTFFLHPVPRPPLALVREIIVFCASILLIRHFIYMMLAPVYDIWAAHRDVKYRDEIAAYRPLVSVVVPGRNEAVGIVGTMKSLLANTYAPMEIVVINDGSTDNMHEVVMGFLDEVRENPERYPGKAILYQEKKNGGKARALNTGIGLASGEIIISIDADCLVTPNAIANFVKLFIDPEVMAAVGNVKIGNTKTLVGTVQYLEYLFSFYFKKADSLMNSIYVIGGAAGAFRREVFDRVGFYNTHNMTEDIDLSMRIQDAGMKIAYASDAIIYTEGASDLKGLMKQRLRWKRGRFQTFWEFRTMLFRTKNNPNKVFSWIVFPIALFWDFQLFFEIFFIAFLYFYSYWTGNFSVFVSGMIVVASLFFVQIWNDPQGAKRLSFILAAPIGWLLFYLPTFVEHNALVRGFWAAIRGREVEWQVWSRKGAVDVS